jgi:HEAT repeat protein
MRSAPPVHGPRLRRSVDRDDTEPSEDHLDRDVGPSNAALAFGILSLVVGLAQLIVSPFTGTFGFLILPIGFVGFLLGAIGLFVGGPRKAGSRTAPAIGLGINAIGSVIVISWLVIAALHASSNRTASMPVAAADAQDFETKPGAEGDDWPDAFTGTTVNGVRIKLTKAEIDVVKFHIASEFVSDEKHLRLWIRIENTSRSRKLDFKGWGTRRFLEEVPAPTLSDNVGNTYRRVNFGAGAEVEGQVQSVTIYPGQVITDLVVFERPVAKCDLLHLKLPAENLGGSGPIRLQIRASDVRVNSAPQPSATPPMPKPPEPPPPTAAELVPVHLAELKSPDAETRRKGIAGLREAGSAAAAAFTELIAALHDSDPEVRAGAVTTIAGLGSSANKAYCALLRATADEDAKVQQAAEAFVTAFGKPPADSIGDLSKLAQDAKLPVPLRVRALALLTPFGSESHAAIQVFLISLKSPEDSIRLQAIKSLAAPGRIQDVEVLPKLFAALADPNAKVAELAADAIDKSAPATANDLPTLVEGLKSSSFAARMAAVHCLTRMGKEGREAAAEVLAAFRDREGSVRLAALECLFAIAPERGSDAAVLLADRDKDVRKAATTALRRALGPNKTFELLTDALSDSDDAVRKDVAAALDEVDVPSKNDIPPRLRIRLSAALSDKSPFVRVKAAKALQRLGWGSDKLNRELAQLVREENDEISREAAETLDLLGPDATRRASQALIRALTSKNAGTRKAAAKALLSAGELHSGAILDLIAALADNAIHDDLATLLSSFGADAVGALSRALDSNNAEIRVGAAKALGKIGSNAKEAYRALITRYEKDPDPRVREAASKAMGEIRRK